MDPETAVIQDSGLIMINLGELWIDPSEAREVVDFLYSTGHEDKASRMSELFESMGILGGTS
jgi:hypothetical protein